VRTAEIAFGGSGVSIIQDARLRECNYGSLNGTPISTEERPRYVHAPYPEGESYRQVVDRVRSFLADLARAAPGERVLVIGHAAPHFALEHLLNGRDLAELVAKRRVWQPGWRYLLVGA
jgi:broad specificity phosphatase PhoE